jgi:LemA protein
VIWVVGLVALVILASVAFFASYNRFVRQRNLIDNSWSDIDTELKRRYDLVPNLVETVKGYAGHESGTLEAVTQARTRAMADAGSPDQQSQTENDLVGQLRSLIAVSESYPELKANAGFLDLQHELVSTEDRIQAARRFYNGNVRDYNARVQSIPTNLVARLTGFAPREYFQVDEAVATTPTVALDDGTATGPRSASSGEPDSQ